MNSTESQHKTEKRSLLQLGHLELLVMLVSLFILQSILHGQSTFQRVAFNVLFFALVLSAIRTLSKSKARMRIAIGLGVVAFLGSCGTESYSRPELVAFVYGCYFVVFILLVAALTESVFLDETDDIDRIIGAVSIYLVLGMVWTFAYALLENFQPGSFEIPTYNQQGIQLEMLSELLYFSNVTLTTVGYGDIIPVSHPAQMLATLEAMVGQLYVAIVIAHLVGLRVSQSRSK